jgi:hypothetical protein
MLPGENEIPHEMHIEDECWLDRVNENPPILKL